MFTAKTAIESIKDGVTMADIMEYVSAWIAEARTMADTIDAQFFYKRFTRRKKRGGRTFREACTVLSYI